MNDITERPLREIIAAKPTSDGDGVRIQRIAGRNHNRALDPFLLIDEIRSDDSKDYIGGFPPHPHRGFETITYMLHGSLQHEDHLGNQGSVSTGGAQWMTAGRGIIHSEMPQQDKGLLHGFQLWLNLSAEDKMCNPQWQDVHAEQMSRHQFPGGTNVTLIAGQLDVNYDNHSVQLIGPIQTRTQAVIADLELPAGKTLEWIPAAQATGLLYIIEGATDQISAGQLGVYGWGDKVTVTAQNQPLRALWLSGMPLQEPIVQYGPFVMNTQAQVQQAMEDYQHNRFV